MFRFNAPAGEKAFARELSSMEYVQLFTDYREPVYLRTKSNDVMDVRHIHIGDRLALRQFDEITEDGYARI